MKVKSCPSIIKNEQVHEDCSVPISVEHKTFFPLPMYCYRKWLYSLHSSLKACLSLHCAAISTKPQSLWVFPNVGTFCFVDHFVMKPPQLYWLLSGLTVQSGSVRTYGTTSSKTEILLSLCGVSARIHKLCQNHRKECQHCCQLKALQWILFYSIISIYFQLKLKLLSLTIRCHLGQRSLLQHREDLQRKGNDSARMKRHETSFLSLINHKWRLIKLIKRQEMGL